MNSASFSLVTDDNATVTMSALEQYHTKEIKYEAACQLGVVCSNLSKADDVTAD